MVRRPCMCALRGNHSGTRILGGFRRFDPYKGCALVPLRYNSFSLQGCIQGRFAITGSAAVLYFLTYIVYGSYAGAGEASTLCFMGDTDMRSKFSKSFLIVTVIVSLICSPAYANDSTEIQNDSFYYKLSKLLAGTDTSGFFNEMELTIGLNTLSVDGETQVLDAAPEIYNSRTMLPIRAIAEAAGAEVEWEQETRTVTITSAYGDEVSCTIGSNVLTINDEDSLMDVSPYVKSGRTYLPVRAVSEALEMDVDWEGSTATVTLTAPYQSARLLVVADRLNTDDLGAETVLSDGTGLWVLQFASPTEAKVAAALLEADGVSVEPDLYLPPVIDEPSSNISTQSSNHYTWGVADCKFEAFVANNKNQFSGSEIVAVIDTGVDSTHSFLRSHMLSGYDFVDGDNDPRPGSGNKQDHGTHVAGIIIDCACGAPVSIMPIRALREGGGTIAAVAAGIKYAANHGADVINLSLGGGHSSTMDSAISYAIGKGCTVVVSAGNDNINTASACPAHLTTSGVLVVSAGDSRHNRSIWSAGQASNYGNSVDVMAPGTDVRASIPGDSYGDKDGTSMAAPHVSAAVALLDLAWDKTLSPSELEAKVRSATTYGTWTNQAVGCGFLDMSKADVPRNVTPSISLSKSSLVLNVGSRDALTAKTTPANTSISWTSNNTNVVAVDNMGNVTAVSAGSARVTASITVNSRSYSSSCSVTVSAPGISISRSSLSLGIGDQSSLSASTTVSGSRVSWSSSSPSVASVSDSGLVTAVGEGTALISASITVDSRTYSDKCTVTVVGNGWTTVELPQKDGFTVETKNQYRYRDKSTTTSSESSLAGWTLYDEASEYGPWGPWSEWENGSGAINVKDSNLIEVETRHDGTTYYNLYYYKYWNAGAGAYYYTYSSGMGGTKYTATAKADEITPYQSYDGHQAYTYNGHDLWWIESFRYVANDQYRVRERSRTVTYYFYKWGDWSDWQDDPFSSTVTREVDSRRIYRYRAL